MPIASRLVWINGPFGAGKSSAAAALVTRLEGTVLLDPEQLGFVLREVLPIPTGDFQDLPEWRELWVQTAAALSAHATRTVVMPMSVLDQDRCQEIADGLRGTGVQLDRVVLDISEAALRRRVEHDVSQPAHATVWRTAKIAQFNAARQWLLATADLTIDSGHADPDQVAEAIARHLRAGVQPKP